MSVFMLETDAATSAASSISSLASQVANISSSVSGYDTACEDGFNFAGAKGVIAGNLEACSIKISNTAKVIESVVSQHTQLQNQLKFQDPSQQGGNTTGGNTTGGNTTGGNTTGGNTTGGNYNYDGGSSYSGGYYSTGGGSSSKEDDKKEDDKKEEEKDKTGEVKTKLEKVGYAYADEANLSEDTKKLLKDEQFKYDENGYAMIGNRYVITCDSSIANVGDVIRFKQQDGKYVECVVGVTTVSEKYKDTINFIVNKNASGIKVQDITKNLLTNSAKIENVGKLSEVRKNELIQAVQEASQQSSQTTSTTTDTTTPATTTTPTTDSGTTTVVTETPTEQTPVSTTDSNGVQTINLDTNPNDTVQV